MQYRSRIWVLATSLVLSFTGYLYVASAEQSVLSTEGGIVIGQSKQQVFDALVKREDVLSVWPSTVSRTYIDRENVEDIGLLRDSDMLVISGLGIFINVQLDNQEIWEIEEVTSSSREVLEKLPTDDFDAFFGVLRELILDGTVDGVQSLPRKNPNNDRAIVSTIPEPNSNTEVDFEWLFSYDRWDFSEEGKRSHYILIFQDDKLKNIEYRR